LRVDRGAGDRIDPGAATALLPGAAAAIIEFVAGHDRTVAFVVDSSGIHAVTLPAHTPEIARQVEVFRTLLANRDLRVTAAARVMYDLVLGPLRPHLAHKTDLVIVPDGPLWDLPFQALRSSADRYLIEDVAVSYAPSLTVLREMMRRRLDPPARRTLVAFANPGAAQADAQPETEHEVRRLADIYGPSTQVYAGMDAREERWKSEAPRYRVVHVAAHGVLDNGSPMYSYLRFAPPVSPGGEDGLLEAWEIMNVPLNADLVVLSACETARGQFAAGEGVLGLMWALFVAGSPATLVSQWRVDSAASTTLMVAFHRQWHESAGGLSKARALRAAALSAIHTHEFSHPFYWAGFILVGDAR
jgi:CHAT domain-containing protein